MNKSIITASLILALGLTACGNKSTDSTASNTAENTNTENNQAPYPPKDDSAPAIVENPTTLSWNKMEHDFGKVKKETAHDYEFVFKNTGNKPLVINSAKGSCGCTVPEYPKEPVMPGAEAKIKVTYTAGTAAGETEKTVTIDANTEPRTTILKIKANVD